MDNDVLYIVMPAYNEEENIVDVVKQWYPIVKKMNNDSRLVIFDDGSKDDTYKRMLELAQDHPYFIPQTKSNSGHGATCLYAYRYALQNNADYIFQTDSDGQTNPEEFWQFWDNRENYDILIGERINRQDGLSRVFVTKVLRIIVRLFLGVWVADANTPFRLMKHEKLKEYLKIIPEDFFLANVVITAIAKRKKQKIYWTPISFKPRQKGINSINIKKIFKIGVQSITDFKKINKQL